MKKAGTVRKAVQISHQRIRGKLAECEFFLQRMTEATDVQEFEYFLSAFLSALSTFSGLALMRKQPKNAEKARKELKDKPDEVGFLLRSRDVEVHRDGVRLWLLKPSGDRRITPRLRASLWGDLLLTRDNSRIQDSSRYGSRYRSRFQPRYKSRFGDVRAPLELSTPDATGKDARCCFIFEDSGQGVLQSCGSALDAIRALAD